MKALTCGFVLLLTGCGWLMPISPLIEAARAGDTAEVQRLLASGAPIDEPGGVNNWTPLLHAIHKNQSRVVRVLVKAGADVNLVRGNTTALKMAAGYGQTDIVHILLEFGAEPDPAALAAAVGGTADPDDFTLGKCQTATVRALLAHDPSLSLPGNSMAVRTARVGGCQEVLKLLGQ